MKRQTGYDRLWNWFSWSRASWLTIPRSVAHQMPDEWQGKLTALLEEYEEATRKAPDPITMIPKVLAKQGNRFTRWPSWLLNYRHPHPDDFAWMDVPKDQERVG